jgi:hypothetical protein
MQKSNRNSQNGRYHLQKCASHNENTQKWITKDANTEDIAMKGFRIKMPMLSTIEVATVADTSKQADKSPTTVHTKTKKKGRPSKNVGKGATTGAENNNENTDVNGTPIETDQSEKIAEELEAWELFNFTLNDDKVNWCEREFFARWEAYNGKLPLPLYGKELLDMEDNNDNTGWATLSRKRNNKKKAADEKRKTSDPIKLSSKPARKKVPAKTKASSPKPTRKSLPTVISQTWKLSRIQWSRIFVMKVELTMQVNLSFIPFGRNVWLNGANGTTPTALPKPMPITSIASHQILQ